MWLALILASLTILAIVGASCGGSEPSNAYEELLALIPDTPETRSSVYMYDYALIRERFDIPWPGPEDGEEVVDQYLEHVPPFPISDEHPYPLISGGAIPFISWAFHTLEPVPRESRRLAFDLRNEEQAAVVWLPRAPLDILRGRFDPEATDRALSTCSGECTPPDTQEEYQGVTFYSWGRDYEVKPRKRLSPPAFDRSGRGGRIAVGEGHLFRSVETPGMKALIDTSQGKHPSLADEEEFRLLAKGLAELDAYAAFVSDETWGFDKTLEGLGLRELDIQGLRGEFEGEPMLRPYEAYATGVGRDDTGAYLALVLVHNDARATQENVQLLRRRVKEARSWYYNRPWAENFYDADRMEVRAKGRMLLAKLRPSEDKNQYVKWVDWVFHRDPLLLHE